jgi:hypothetical protein
LQAPAEVACPLALPPRLKVGMTARVTTNLHFRSSAGIAAGNLVHSNLSGTKLEIIGGPVCVPYNGRAYLWWNVKQPDGATGWSAEGSLTGKFYFLEPLP